MSKYLPRILIGVVAGILLYFVASSVEGPGFMALFTGVFGGIATAYILSNLAGNRKVATAGGAQKEQALALAPPPGKALLVVAREGFVAKLVGLNLNIDGQPFTQLKSPAFTIVEVAPGQHALATGFGGLAGPQNKAGVYDFSAAEGQVVAVVVTVSMGALQNAFKFTPQTDLEALRRKLRGMPMVLPEPAPAPAVAAAAPA